MAARFRLDVLARAVEGVQERTISGALVTVGSVVVIAALLILEVKSFFTTTTQHHIGVDDGKRPFGSRHWTMPDRLPVRIYMTFGRVPCDGLTLDMDATRSDFDPLNSVEFREPTFDELEWAGDVDATKACTLDGRLTIGKVSANFHIEVADRQDKLIPLPFSAFQIANNERRRHLNISHKVHALHFGDTILKDTVAPLDGVVNAPDVAGQQHYLLKVIPTVLDHGTTATATNQYSLAEHFIRFDAVALSPCVLSPCFCDSRAAAPARPSAFSSSTTSSLS